MDIGTKIKKLRKEKGLTQKELAEKTSLSVASIQGYEQGKYKPKLETVKKLAQVLCTSTSSTDLLEFKITNADVPLEMIMELLAKHKDNIHSNNLEYINLVLESIDHKYVNELSDILHKDEEIQEMFWKIVGSLGLLNKNGFEKVSDFANDMQKIDEYRIGYTPIIHTDDE